MLKLRREYRYNAAHMHAAVSAPSSLMCSAAVQAIALFGTDFSLMEKMFPGRQRKALKLKLRREYKDNAERVDAALSGKGSGAKSYQEVVNALHRVRIVLLEQLPSL